MGYLVGIDEAGYGPLLGPLVVSASAFRVRDDVEACEAVCLWERLAGDAVRRRPARARSRAEGLVVCDSKVLHRAARGPERMEEAVLSFLAASPADQGERASIGGPGAAVLKGPPLGALLGDLGVDLTEQGRCPWYGSLERPVPVLGFGPVLRRKAEALGAALAAAGVEARGLRPAVAHPAAFNRGVREHGNKHLFEWSIVGRLLKVCWERFAGEGALVTVDRLSGRKRYGPGLARLFPGARVTAVPGRPDAPTFDIAGGGRRLRVRFLEKGDDKVFEVALASLCSKYLRELLMAPLNEWFRERVPGLKPTAGYVQDGRRFLEDVGPVIDELSIDRDLLVRCR